MMMMMMMTTTMMMMMMMMATTTTTNISFNIIIICNEWSLSSRYCNRSLYEFYSPSLLSSQSEKKCNYKTANGVKNELVRILIFYTGIKTVAKFRFWENISNTNDLLLHMLTNRPQLWLKYWEAQSATEMIETRYDFSPLLRGFADSVCVMAVRRIGAAWRK